MTVIEALRTNGQEPTTLVNNAGMLAASPSTSRLRGTRPRAVIGFMRAAGWGRIVTVTSASGTLVASRGSVAYVTGQTIVVDGGNSVAEERFTA